MTFLALDVSRPVPSFVGLLAATIGSIRSAAPSGGGADAP
jgi:hypothetical protein